MGRLRKRHNQKAREQHEIKVDHSKEKKIKLDPQVLGEGNSGTVDYDDSNPLVLPSAKRKTIKVTEKSKQVPLTRKQRKRLEKIVELKEKKSKRKDLLDALAKVQATENELQMLQSTAAMHSNKKNLIIEGKTHAGTKTAIAISKRAHKKSEKGLKGLSLTDNIEQENSSDESSDETDGSSDSSDEDIQDSTEDIHVSLNESTKISENEQDSSLNITSNIPPDIESSNIKDTQGTLPTVPTDKSEKPSDNIEYVRKTIHVPVNRSQEVQEERLKLPILAEEQSIVESINDNPIVIICGETGSGKTTQVPQFLYEAGYASDNKLIGVTEPRRVAAVSMSSRIATEMSLSSRDVSYQIRYEGNTTPDTKIKFMTDGVLLKEVQKDFLLTKYSVVIIDEAHERSVYTDILIGLLSRIVPLRNKRNQPLKLVIMSATLRVEDFTENSRLFKIKPPIINVDSRQYPVTIHFNKRTPDDYVSEAFKKICKVHRQLPEGGILVFVTGQQEVHTLCKKLRSMFSQKSPDVKRKVKKLSRKQFKEEKNKMETCPKINLDNYSVNPLDEEAAMEDASDLLECELSDDEDYNEEDANQQVSEDAQAIESDQAMYVLPLYSLLSSSRQKKVFNPPPEGHRLCVISTNVAETSLTIPHIKYVIDTGKTKTKFFDKVTGVSTFKVTWASQASCNQRAGRAGRTSPGHCYRLYSSAVFNDDFELFSLPEIMRRPVDDLVLQMKDMNIEKVINFPFPSPPSVDALKAAEAVLVSLGALKSVSKQTGNRRAEPVTKITPLGKTMASFPVSPRYGKMLALGHQHELLPYVIALVSALSVQELLIETDQAESSETDDTQKKEFQRHKHQQILQLRKTMAGSNQSLLLGDLMVLLKSVGAAEYTGCSPKFCEDYGIRYKAMVECRKLRTQLTNAVNTVLIESNLLVDPKLSPPSDLQIMLLRQIILAGLADHVARKRDEPLPGVDKSQKKLKYSYQCTTLEDPVYIHPSSVLHKSKAAEYIVYQHIVETGKLYMKGISVIEPEWLPVFAPQYCTFNKPLETPAPRYDADRDVMVCHMSSTFARCSWPIPAVEVEFPESIDKYRHFATSLLAGDVFKKLKEYSELLLSPPITMTKSWAKLHPRTETMLKTLLAECISNKKQLCNKLAENPNYLLYAYLEWIPESVQQRLKTEWPPLDNA